MQDPYEHIEAYLAGALSPEHKAAFEAAMASDDQLKQAVEDFGFMDLIGEALVEQEIRGLVDAEVESGAVEEELPLRRIPNRLWPKLLLVLIGIAVLWVINTYVIAKQKETKHQPLFAEVINEPAWPGSRSDNPTKIEEFIALYQSGQEAIAKDSLKALSTAESYYWVSELYLNEQKFDSTLFFLQLDLDTDDKLRRDRKQFIHILALYFSGDKFRAKTAYASLPDDVHEYYLDRLGRLGI